MTTILATAIPIVEDTERQESSGLANARIDELESEAKKMYSKNPFHLGYFCMLVHKPAAAAHFLHGQSELKLQLI